MLKSAERTVDPLSQPATDNLAAVLTSDMIASNVASSLRHVPVARQLSIIDDIYKLAEESGWGLADNP